jgi:class 3 adenylate cyclase
MDRKLAAIMSADVVGYSRLTALDEEGTIRALGQSRERIDGLVAQYGGRIFGVAGDGVMAAAVSRKRRLSHSPASCSSRCGHTSMPASLSRARS